MHPAVDPQGAAMIIDETALRGPWSTIGMI
jgi:hypothetical protein